MSAMINGAATGKPVEAASSLRLGMNRKVCDILDPDDMLFLKKHSTRDPRLLELWELQLVGLETKIEKNEVQEWNRDFITIFVYPRYKRTSYTVADAGNTYYMCPNVVVYSDNKAIKIYDIEEVISRNKSVIYTVYCYQNFDDKLYTLSDVPPHVAAFLDKQGIAKLDGFDDWLGLE